MERMSPNSDAVRIREIDWLQTLPILRFCECIRIVFSLQALLPLVLLLSIWEMGRQRLPSKLMECQVPVSAQAIPAIIHDLLGHTLACFEWIDHWLMAPAQFKSAPPLHQLTWPIVWDLTILSLAALVTSRISVMHFCRHQRAGAISSMRFAVIHFRRLAGAIVILALMLLASALGLTVVRWVSHFSLIQGSSVMLLTVWCMGLLTICVRITAALALPLVPVGIAADNCTAPDAVSRSINYVLSRWLLTAVTLVAAAAASFVAASIGQWLADLSNTASWNEMFAIVQKGSRSPPLAVRLVQAIVPAIQTGAFLSAFSWGYLLLRRQEDGIRLSEISPSSSSNQS
ncbi:MAG: hypothetical protein KDA85_20975 [Planctomycetaceae bacterium]|nr:hypothetical protein [Planctomycetaceae bacterium]